MVIAIASSGLHSNGFSLVRHVLDGRGLSFTDHADELGGVVGEVLLEPTRLYTAPLLRVIDEMPGAIHSLSHENLTEMATTTAGIESLRTTAVTLEQQVDRFSLKSAPDTRLILATSTKQTHATLQPA